MYNDLQYLGQSSIIYVSSAFSVVERTRHLFRPKF